MRYLFTEAPLFVPTMDTSKFAVGQDLERRVEAIEHKQAVTHEN
jgi:hypothetical protein